MCGLAALASFVLGVASRKLLLDRLHGYRVEPALQARVVGQEVDDADVDRLRPAAESGRAIVVAVSCVASTGEIYRRGVYEELYARAVASLLV